MRRVGITFGLLFIALSISATTNIVYIDVSSILDLKAVIETTKNIVLKNKDEDFIIFISNDNNPVIITERYNLNEELNILYEIDPSIPDLSKDIDTLNTLLNEIIHLEFQTDSSELLFSFILDVNQTIFYNHIQSLVDKLLLTNSMIKNGKPIKGVEVFVYFNIRNTTNKVKNKDNINKRINKLIEATKNKGYYVSSF
jgi:hypothetical protein